VVLRKIYGPKRDKATGNMMKLLRIPAPKRDEVTGGQDETAEAAS
jgi:hypothetical protein